METEEAFTLVQLPGLCLQLIFKHLSPDGSSISSAAAAHSKLHEVAVNALSCITARLSQSKVKLIVCCTTSASTHSTSAA